MLEIREGEMLPEKTFDAYTLDYLTLSDLEKAIRRQAK